MKIQTCSMAAVLGMTVLVLAGCGNNSPNPSDGNQPSSQHAINPVVVMTNAPLPTNDPGTNLPAATNSVVGH